MKNRFVQHQTPNNDKDKFDLACKLMAKKIKAETGMPEDIAAAAAMALVSDCMQATERQRERIARQWRMFGLLCVN